MAEVDFEVMSESQMEQVRRLYVYDRNDDFIIEIPAGAKVTFGYFNPGTPTVNQRNPWSNGPGSETMRTTALRIYERGEKGNQLACFMGVNGFRDLDSVKKTIKRKKVTIETNFEDDGLGNVDFARKQAIEPLALTEGEWETGAEEKIPF